MRHCKALVPCTQSNEKSDGSTEWTKYSGPDPRIITSVPLPLTQHPHLLMEINYLYVRGVDKWRRMYQGASSALLDFDGETILFQMKISPRTNMSAEEFIAKVVMSWLEWFSWIRSAENYEVIMFDVTSSATGTSVTPARLTEGQSIEDTLALAFKAMDAEKKRIRSGAVPSKRYSGSIRSLSNYSG